MELRGKDCVNESFDGIADGHDEGLPLVNGLRWMILVDGIEEAASTFSLAEVLLPGLEIGQHLLESKYNHCLALEVVGALQVRFFTGWCQSTTAKSS